jgi:two-component system, chemotaxis family, protein-glutamate methylesterase/glutaminase
VAIGVSTGGPNALDVLLPQLPADLGVPVVITQHMPPMFTRLLAQRLDGRSPLRVSEGVDGAPIGPGDIVVAPGDRHLGLVRRGTEIRQHVHEGPRENSCRPAADVMFRSAVEVWGGGVLGVVLTGMGADGLRGCERIREAGGHVVVQDEATSVVWGMPGFVARAGLAERLVPLDRLAPTILALARADRPTTTQRPGIETCR